MFILKNLKVSLKKNIKAKVKNNKEGISEKRDSNPQP